MNAWQARSALTLCLFAVGLEGRARADVYVAQFDPPSVLVFASDAIGDAAPVRVIAGPRTGLVFPGGLTVDDVHQELYVSDFFGAAIRVFPLDADGDVAPLRTLLDGPASQLGFPRHLAVDVDRDEILVPSFAIPPTLASAVRTYPRTGAGDLAPRRSLVGASTRLDNPIDLALRAGADEILVNSYLAGDGSPGLLAFARSADGDVGPVRAIAGPTTRLGGFTNLLAYDAETDEVYADVNGEDLGYAAFAAGADGDVAPLRLVSGPSTGLHHLRGLAFDAANRRVIALDTDAEDDPLDPSAVRVFARTEDGDAPAEAILAGPHTQMRTPIAVAVDARGMTGMGPRVHATPDGFEAAVSDPAALATETFDAAQVEPARAQVCAEPLGAASNDDCFAPGQLLDGFAVRSASGTGVVAVGAGFVGNAPPVVGAVLTGDTTVIELDPPRTELSFAVHAYNGPGDAGATVALVDGADRVVSFTRVRPRSPGEPAFVGVVSPVAIARVELASASGAGVALVDDLRTTGLAPGGPGPGVDAGAGDGAAGDEGDGGCGCRSGAHGGAGPALAALLAALGLGVGRARRGWLRRAAPRRSRA